MLNGGLEGRVYRRGCGMGVERSLGGERVDEMSERVSEGCCVGPREAWAAAREKWQHNARLRGLRCCADRERADEGFITIYRSA